MEKSTSELIQSYAKAKRDSLLPMLQEIQKAHGFLDEDALREVAEWLEIPFAKVFGVATFYDQFRFSPRAKVHLRVCGGTACHVAGSYDIIKELKKKFGIKEGKLSKDNVFSLEIVPCMGACAQSPVISANGEYHIQLKKEELSDILENFKNREDIYED